MQHYVIVSKTYSRYDDSSTVTCSSGPGEAVYVTGLEGKFPSQYRPKGTRPVGTRQLLTGVLRALFPRPRLFEVRRTLPDKDCTATQLAGAQISASLGKEYEFGDLTKAAARGIGQKVAGDVANGSY